MINWPRVPYFNGIFTGIMFFYSAAEMLNKFHELDADRSGKLDQQEAKEGLELMTTATGRKLDPREIEFFLKTASDDEGFIDIGKFVSLFKRLKVYDSPAPPKNAKCHVLGSDWKVNDVDQSNFKHLHIV